ncbi:MAG: leucine-rich repeat protein [Oscillospiraceae bacterium]|nr:leucine-rich repeat protein [Oscillospiraceae bacterium]
MTRLAKLLCLVLILALAPGVWQLPPAHAAEVPNHGCTDGHSWGPWVEEVVADCDTEGVLVRTCTLCEAQERVTIPPMHNYDYQVTVTEPTCTEGGYITHACKCGDSYRTPNGDALGHDILSHEAQAPACEEIGWQAYESCTRCDYSTYAEIPATGHSWSDWEYVDDNLQQRSCYVCGARETKPVCLYGGTCGEQATWTLDAEGTLTVFGTGWMDQYYGNMPWEPHAKLIKKVVVEEGITAVTWGAFNNCPNLVTAEFADTVTTIQSEVFSNCGALRSVKLGSGLNDIGSNAFYRCFNLRKIELPASLTWIGSGAFFNCETLRQITIPAAVTYIGDQAFTNCDVLNTLIFLGDAPSFGENCFLNVTATAHYPQGNETWTEEIRQDYGGAITWVSTCGEDHTWSGWEATRSPACTLEGREIRVCSRCQWTEERMTAASGHSWGQWTSSGSDRVRACQSCGAKEFIYAGPQMGRNIGDHFYPDGEHIDGINYLFHRRWATTIKSTLAAENGGYTRVEYIDGVLVIEAYDADLSFLSGRGIPLELPIYGGVYLGQDFNFVVSGQENPAEDDQAEVIRVTRYTKDWVKLDHASLFGANTTEPFNCGTLRFARSGDMLYIRTSHEMYEHTDGVNHQANVSLGIHIPTMEITDSSYTISYSGTGYVSHSFNQFVLIDGNDYIALDHGDANPRSLVMFRCQGSAGNSTLPFFKEEIDVLKIATNIGSYNDTGVAVGGLAASSTHYIVVGNTVDQSVIMEQRYGQRNIFISLTPKDDFSEEATQGFWLTKYAEDSGVEISPPHIVEVEEDLFLLIWTENDSLRHCYISGQGELLSDIYENEGALSDCVPILDGNRVLWYTTGTLAGSNGYLIMKDDGLPVFYQIDLADPGKVTHPTSQIRYGDTNGDGAVNGKDLILLRQSLAGWDVELNEAAADCNGDRSVNGKDLILLRQHLAGWDVTLGPQ